MFSKQWFKIRQVITSFRHHTKEKPKKKGESLYFRRIHFLFKENLFLTNTISSGVCMGLAELMIQEYEYRTHVISEYEWSGIKRMFIVGAVLGSLHHYYYLYLDVLLPKSTFTQVFLKVAGDQFFCAPLTIVLFFYLMGLLELKTLEQCTDELNRKFLTVYLGDCAFWPPVQFVNFYYVPSVYRVFYINVATMVFDVFLSIMKHYKEE